MENIHGGKRNAGTYYKIWRLFHLNPGRDFDLNFFFVSRLFWINCFHKFSFIDETCNIKVMHFRNKRRVLITFF